MISEYIYKSIKDNISAIQDGSRYHIYPSVVPDAVIFNKAIVYTLLNAQTVYNLTGASIQVSCYAKTNTGASDLVAEVVQLFQSKSFQNVGEVLNTSVQSVIAIPYDRDLEYYCYSATIYLKTTLAFG